MEALSNLYISIINFLTEISTYSVIINCILIVFESILPILPLSLFITVLFVNYGAFIGFLISWVFTVIGCVLSFYLFQTVFQKIVERKVRNHKNFDKFLTAIDTISFSGLVSIIAMPFTPAFLVNIVAGVSKMHIKKFLYAIMIGKVSLVIFWGYIGTTLIESLKHAIELVKVVILVVIAYFISKFINKKYNLD